ncbi:Uncharacterised protein [Vibrio cholerae]|nr:Uncharacterised protein [Vibrio cholerae]CSI38272.1 Uncharacterised protein [Vibrio cholerae]
MICTICCVTTWPFSNAMEVENTAPIMPLSAIAI